MNTKHLMSWVGAALLGMTSLSAQAIPDLYGYSFNVDGAVTDVKLNPFDPIVAAPAGVDISGFSDVTGLGIITATITGAGAHTFDAFFDHEIDAVTNTFFNESASASGSAAAGQSWEIDEPGYGSLNNGTGGTQYFGDIFANFEGSALDNQIFFDAFDGQSLVPAVDDVSMAMGWDFNLNLGETALITLLLSDTDNGGGFFLTHSDANSQYEFYLSSTLSITGGPGTGVPEPSVFLLLGIGLAGMMVNQRRRKV